MRGYWARVVVVVGCLAVGVPAALAQSLTELRVTDTTISLLYSGGLDGGVAALIGAFPTGNCPVPQHQPGVPDSNQYIGVGYNTPEALGYTTLARNGGRKPHRVTFGDGSRDPTHDPAVTNPALTPGTRYCVFVFNTRTYRVNNVPTHLEGIVFGPVTTLPAGLDATTSAATIAVTPGVNRFRAVVTFPQPAAWPTPVNLWVSSGACPAADGNGNMPGGSLAYRWETTPPAEATVTITHRGQGAHSVRAVNPLQPGPNCMQIVTAEDRNVWGRSAITPVQIMASHPAPTGVSASASAATAAEGDMVTLTGAGTAVDDFGDDFAATYAWTHDADPVLPGGVTLDYDADAQSPSFIVPPALTAETEVTFTLTVTGSGGATATATAMVTLQGVNDAPMAVAAGAAQEVAASVPALGAAAAVPVTVTLTATEVTDVDSDTLTYNWAQVTDAAGATTIASNAAGAVTLSAAGVGRTVTFMSPMFVDAAGMRTAVGLEADGVTSRDELSLYFRVHISDGNCDAPGTTTAAADCPVDVVMVRVRGESPPTASVTEADIMAAPGAMVTLVGTGAAQSPIASYAWACPATATLPPGRESEVTAPTVTVTVPGTAMATFMAPELAMNAAGAVRAPALAQIVLTCTLTVIAPGGSDSAEVVVTIANRGGGAVDDAVLPEVLRNINRGIHNSIYNRIQQRQRDDGKWQ